VLGRHELSVRQLEQVALAARIENTKQKSTLLVAALRKDAASTGSERVPINDLQRRAALSKHTDRRRPHKSESQVSQVRGEQTLNAEARDRLLTYPLFADVASVEVTVLEALLRLGFVLREIARSDRRKKRQMSTKVRVGCRSLPGNESNDSVANSASKHGPRPTQATVGTQKTTTSIATADDRSGLDLFGRQAK
jgi:hypothetical protein